MRCALDLYFHRASLHSSPLNVLVFFVFLSISLFVHNFRYFDIFFSSFISLWRFYIAAPSVLLFQCVMDAFNCTFWFVIFLLFDPVIFLVRLYGRHTQDWRLNVVRVYGWLTDWFTVVFFVCVVFAQNQTSNMVFALERSEKTKWCVIDNVILCGCVYALCVHVA